LIFRKTPIDNRMIVCYNREKEISLHAKRKFLSKNEERNNIIMKKTTLRILTALLALLFVLTAFVGCNKKVSKNPDQAVLDAINTNQKLAEKSDLHKKFEGYAEFNSVEYNIAIGDLIGSLFSSFMGGMDVSLTSTIDLNMKMLTSDDHNYAVLALLLNDADFVRIDAHATTEELALACEALLGKTAFGAKLDDLFDLFGDQLGASMDMSLAELTEMSAKSAEITKDLEKILEKYKEVAIKALFENADATRTEETVKVGGDSVEAVIVKATVDEERFTQALKKLYETYKADTKTRETVEDILKLYGSTDADIADIYDGIEELWANNDFAEDTVELTFTIHKKNGNLMVVSLYSPEEDENISLTLGVDPVNPTYFAFDAANEFSLAYLVTENTAESYKAELSIDVEGEKVDFPISYNKTTDEYTISFEVEGQTFEILGKLTAETDIFSFSIDQMDLVIEGQPVSLKTGISLTMTKSNEKIPAMPEYTDVTEMSEEDFAELAGELQTKLNELLTLLPTDIQFLLGSLMGGGIY